MQKAIHIHVPAPVQEYRNVHPMEYVDPVPSSTAHSIHVSHFGVIPKRRQPGKWRLTLDLSFPQERDKQWHSQDLILATVDDATQLIAKQAQGTLLTKINILYVFT